MSNATKRNAIPQKVIALCGLILLFILAVTALRVPFRAAAPRADALPDTVRKREALEAERWPDGFRLYRYWWVGDAAVYVAEMDRDAFGLRFDVELANTQILGRETISGATKRLMRKEVLPFAGVNGSFGIREDSRGRGGMIFNLHIENGELVSIPTPLDRWGYSPPSPWGETSFGVTPEGEFLMDRVELNGMLEVEGETFEINGVNQICDSLCPVVIYTPRFGRRTLTRRCYEFTLESLELPLTGKYRSRFVVTDVSKRGNSPIPLRGAVIAVTSSQARVWREKLKEAVAGEITIALTPEKWQTVHSGVGGNLRILRDGEIEPELNQFARFGRSRSHRNAARRNPRSALGFNDEKLFLIAVDGRQPGYSMGMTLYQMADFFRDLGIKHAINFDGGSSSTLWALGKVVNSPSHGYERRIFNVALIRALKED